MIGKLDVKDRRDVFLPDFFRQKRNGGRRRLCLVTAPREGGVIAQAVLLHEVAQGEPVAKNQRCSLRQCIKERPEILGECLQLLGIGLGVLLVHIAVGTVQRPQLLTDGPCDGGGIQRRGPDVFVQLYHLSLAVVVFMALLVVMVVMVVVSRQLHSLDVIFLQHLHAVHHLQGRSAGLHRVQNGLNPGLALTAQIDEEVTVLHRHNIRRRGLIGVALRAGGQQQLHIRPVSCGGPSKVIGREHGSYNFQLSIVISRFLRCLCGTAAGQQQYTQQKERQDFFGTSH